MRRKIYPFVAVAATVFMLTARHSASGELVELKPSADTTLFQTDPDNNFGTVDSLAVGGTAAGRLARSLLKFDVAASLSATATITSAQLKFQIVKVPTSGGRPSDFRLHRMFQDWSEGTKKGGPRGTAATDSETTWNFRVHSTVRWSQPGGAAPVDFSPTASASVRVAGIGPYTIVSTPELIADVQTWVANPASNFGWMMLSQAERTPETARRVGAREAGGRAPVLTIEYTAAPSAPLSIDRFEIVTNEFRLHFTAEAGQSYQVEFSETLAPGEWKALTNLAPLIMPTSVVVSDLVNRPQRFYRLRSP